MDTHELALESGCWAEFRSPRGERPRPCLFLDRDGVVVEDTGYVHRAEDLRPIAETLDAIVRANRAGWLAGLVTNQSGIGRGYYGWDAFRAVQAEIDRALAERGGRLDFVLACPFHADATVPEYRHPAHPWRKPEPGMLRHAAERLGADLGRSVMVGDRMSDLEAGAAAGIRHLVLIGDRVPRLAESWIAEHIRVVSGLAQLDLF